MKPIRIIKFYFYADKIDKGIDRLIFVNANKSHNAQCNINKCINRIAELTKDKDTLSRLYHYISTVMNTFNEEDKNILKRYCISPINLSLNNSIRRVVVRFTCRAKYLKDYDYELSILDKYYILMGRGDD